MSQTAAEAFALRLQQADADLLVLRGDLHREAAMCRAYLAESEPTRIGGAGTACYRARKNKRLGALHTGRLSEMRQRAEAAEARMEKLPLLYEYCFPIYGQCAQVCHRSLGF